MADSLDFERNVYVCPFCGNTQKMKIVKEGDSGWAAVANQKCSECDEEFDLETWESIEDHEAYSNDSYYGDDEEENSLAQSGFLLDNEIVTEDDIEDIDDFDDFEDDEYDEEYDEED